MITDPAYTHTIVLSAAASALLFAAAHDVAARTVPNFVSLIVAAAGLGLSVPDGHLTGSLFNSGLVFMGGWYCWRRGWIGGGDVKLLTAATLLVPPASVPELILSTAIAGGLLALAYVGLSRLLPNGTVPVPMGPRPTGFLRRIWRAERWRIRRGTPLPYCCAIAAGALLTLCSSFGFD